MFAFGQDEEVGGSEGNGNIAKVLAGRHVHFAWVLDEGGAILNEPFPGVQQPVAFMAVAEKGYLTLQLVAHGMGGHSSRPTHDLAIARLSDAVLEVVNHPFASGIDDVQREQFSVLAPYMPFFQRMILANLWLTGPIVSRMLEDNPQTAATMHTTIAPTMISGGVKDNVLPPQATATINFRLHQRDSIQSVIEHVRKAIDDPSVDVRALTEAQSEASKVSDLHDDNGKFIVQAISDSFNGIPVAPTVTTGAAAATKADLYGKMQANVDFGAAKVTGRVDDIQAYRASAVSTVPSKSSVDYSLVFTGDIIGTGFVGKTQMTQAGASTPTDGVQNGAVQGGFFGPQAAETAGALVVTATNGATKRAVVGGFGAKKQ